MIVVGFCSCYREGRLVRAAIDSLLAVEPDALYVYEGPAGDPLENEKDLPASDFRWGDMPRSWGVEHGIADGRIVVRRGRWRTDGRKRNDWLQQVKKDYPDGPVWAVVVDADEVLVNGEYLRDRLEWILARDQLNNASVTDPANPPMARWPLRLVEHDGSISLITARVFRVDLLRSIDHSTSIVTNTAGIRDGWGNYAETSALWIEGWLQAIDRGQMIAWPPLPCEPFIQHRSNLRHPARAGLRMSEQEAVEFRKAEQAELAQGNGNAQAFDVERPAP